MRQSASAIVNGGFVVARVSLRGRERPSSAEPSASRERPQHSQING
jgi:hypothetical protein